MSWKAYSLLEARERFVQAALRGRKSVAQLCTEAGISRKTGFKWLARFRKGGPAALHNRSRRPKGCPRQTRRCWVREIVRWRTRHPSWGAKKIYARLRQRHRRAHLPRVRTIAYWLARLKFVRRRRSWARRGPQVARAGLRPAQAPNDVWTVDFKGWFRTRDGQRVDPLTVRDLFSRFILGIRLLRHRHEPVQQYFQQLFKRYGKPKGIRVDHGPPFAGDGALDLSRLSAWWLRLGIEVDFTRRAHPQDNGAHEQMHRVYKAEVARAPAATPRSQQWCTSRWVSYYNRQRPHEALGQRVPASLYRKSRRTYRKLPSRLVYPRRWRKRRVIASGHVGWRGRLRVIGRAFAGQDVGFKLISEGVHEVYFGAYLIGVLVDTDPGGMRPASWLKAPTMPG